MEQALDVLSSSISSCAERPSFAFVTSRVCLHTLNTLKQWKQVNLVTSSNNFERCDRLVGSTQGLLFHASRRGPCCFLIRMHKNGHLYKWSTEWSETYWITTSMMITSRKCWMRGWIASDVPVTPTKMTRSRRQKLHISTCLTPKCCPMYWVLNGPNRGHRTWFEGEGFEWRH